MNIKKDGWGMSDKRHVSGDVLFARRLGQRNGEGETKLTRITNEWRMFVLALWGMYMHGRYHYICRTCLGRGLMIQRIRDAM